MRKSHVIRFGCVLALALLAALLPSCSGSQGMQVLPALKQASLQGRLIFIVYNPQGNQLVQLDLASGQMRTLFAAPKGSWLAAASVSPDHQTILLAYAPPPPKGQVQLANTELDTLPVDGSSQPVVVKKRAAAIESFGQPAWSPNGKSYYYTHVVPSETDPSGAVSQIERSEPGGSSEILIHSAIWPSISPDGKQLAYLALAQYISENTLSLAQVDGSRPAPLVDGTKFPIVDDHLFSPDGKTIYFSAPDTGLLGASPPENRWLHWGLGVENVSAHNNPSDWFRVPVSGGKVERVYRAVDVNMVATFSPNGQWLAYASQKGLFVMRPDGSQVTQLATLFGMGSINWLP